jgi:3-oxo-4-pregnene-20-carboxyl-CoA dehydrogenase alpha subunit
MDFTRGDAELEISGLAARVLAAAGRDGPPDTSTTATGTGAAEHEAGPWDAGTWKELAQTGLLAVALPAAAGGDGLGVTEVAALLTEVGKRAARVPALATLALGVLPVIRCAAPDVQQQLLAGVGSGETVLTAAIREPSEPMPAQPATVAEGTSAGVSGTGLAVSGVKLGVPYAADARWILAPARMPDGSTAVVVAETGSKGLTCQRTHTSSGSPEYTVRFDRVAATHVLPAGSVAELYRLAVAGACCVADGAVAGALELTTAYVKSREQFGRPLATFQAVAQQIADVYVTARILHLATVSACWRLDGGLDAASDVDVAGYWLAEHAPIALRTCHHLHGGIGMDITYPLPRFSALITDLVSLVGGATYRLDLLGAREGA